MVLVVGVDFQLDSRIVVYLHGVKLDISHMENSFQNRHLQEQDLLLFRSYLETHLENLDDKDCA